jgi:DNA polymerase III delta subunit
MIYFLHGENIVKSRQFLTEIIEKSREKEREIESLNGSQLTIEQVRAALGSDSLFGKGKLVIIENLYSSPKSKRKEALIDFIKKSDFENDLILWERKEIRRKMSVKFKIEIFKLSTAVFKFLESLKPDNQTESLRLLSEVKKKESGEMIFYLLIRQVRFLLLTKDLGEKGLKELQSWQKRRFLSQTKYFTFGQLKKLYQRLQEIDYQQKTSRTPFSLTSELDLLVASL